MKEVLVSDGRTRPPRYVPLLVRLCTETSKRDRSNRDLVRSLVIHINLSGRLGISCALPVL